MYNIDIQVTYWHYKLDSFVHIEVKIKLNISVSWSFDTVGFYIYYSKLTDLLSPHFSPIRMRLDAAPPTHKIEIILVGTSK